MKFLNLLFFAIPESEYEFIRYRNQMEATAFSALSQNGMDVKFLKLKEPGYTPENPNPGEYFFKGINRFFYIPLSMYRYIKKEKPDVLFVHGFIFPVQLFFLKFFIPSKSKIIIQHHAEKPFVNAIKRFIQKIAYSKADAYLFSSPDLALSYLDLEIIPDKNKIHEVMEGSTLFLPKDKNMARKTLGINEETVFLWVGRLNENKDPLLVLEAFRKYKTSTTAFKLYMIYGTSEMETEVKKFIQENDLSSQIQLVGRISHTGLEDWYNAADYFVAASHYEGSGIALCEAMSCGCIPIVSKIPSFISMTDHGDCGYLFDPGNDEQLLKILLGLDPSERSGLKEKVIAKFNKDLSFKAIGLRIYDIIQQLRNSSNH